jgi:hypothetical protein
MWKVIQRYTNIFGSYPVFHKAVSKILITFETGNQKILSKRQAKTHYSKIPTGGPQQATGHCSA